MTTLIFKGEIARGVGRYTQLHIPGRKELTNAPDDWPMKLCRGSLNLNIAPDGYPSELSERDLQGTIQWLDSGFFTPEFDFTHDKIGNNSLPPTKENPQRGHANVWRARLILPHNNVDLKCWVLRRIGSSLRDKLEILSDIHIRDTFGLPARSNYNAEVHLYGYWK